MSLHNLGKHEHEPRKLCLFSQWRAASSGWCRGRASCTRALASNPGSGSRGPDCSEATYRGVKLWCLLLQQMNCLASTVRRCTVLLKHIRVTGNATHDWQHQHLLHRQNLAVVYAVHFHPRLDEEQLSTSQFWDSNGHHQRRGQRWLTTQQAFRSDVAQLRIARRVYRRDRSTSWLGRYSEHFFVREEDRVDSMLWKQCRLRDTVYSMTEKTQFLGFVFPQVVRDISYERLDNKCQLDSILS